MKRVRLFILSVFILGTMSIDAQGVTMLGDSIWWSYFMGKMYDSATGLYFCDSEVQFITSGVKEKNGKTYHRLFLNVLHLDGGGSANRLLGVFKEELPGLREEGGRVYVDKQEYMTYFANTNSWDYPMYDAGYMPYVCTEEGEIVLYDFNMEVGDKYCSVPGYEDISVVSITDTCLADNVVRKKFELSNGLEIVEGIGCVNSVGMLLLYLNYKFSPENERYSSQLFAGLSAYGPRKEFPPRYWVEYDDIAASATDIRHVYTGKNVDCRADDGAIFDFGGRRVTGKPYPGLYIRNGRKLIVK